MNIFGRKGYEAIPDYPSTSSTGASINSTIIQVVSNPHVGSIAQDRLQILVRNLSQPNSRIQLIAREISSPANLNAILHTLGDFNVNQETHQEAIASYMQAVDNCMRHLDLSAIREAARALIPSLNQSEEFITLIQNVKSQLARPTIQKIHSTPSAIAYKQARSSYIENLLTATWISTVYQEPNNLWSATQMLQAAAVYVVVPFILAASLDEMLQKYTPDYIDELAFFILIITFMSLIYGSIRIHRHFRPIPSHIKPLTNFTLAAQNNEIEPLLYRDTIIERVFRCWAGSNNAVRQHPLIVGDPGVGKSSICMELGRRIAKKEIPHELQHKMKDIQFFWASAGAFIPTSSMEPDNRLEQMMRFIGSHKELAVIGLDEIHALLNEKNGPRYAEALKPVLDTSLDGLPYVICSTTEEEYQKYIGKSETLSRRFSKIDVPRLKKPEILLVLQNMSRQFSNVLVPDSTLELIYTGAEGLYRDFSKQGITQPEISKRILMNAIYSFNNAQNQLPTEKQLRKKEEALEILLREYLAFIENPNDEATNISEENAQREAGQQPAEGLHDKRTSSEEESGSIQMNNVPLEGANLEVVGIPRSNGKFNVDKHKELLGKISSLEGEITTLKATKEKESRDYTNFRQVTEKINELQKKRIALAKQTQPDNQSEQIEKEFIFLSFYLLPDLKRLHHELTKKLKLPSLAEQVRKETQIIRDSFSPK